MALKTLDCGGVKLDLSRTQVMGILNVTPDSFYDGGSHYSTDAAVEHARRMIREGADVIDVGGESTRPGSKSVPVSEELRRVVPVIKSLAEERGVCLSVDTYKPEVARAALKAGARMINDVYGLRKEGMSEVAAEYGVPVVVMHMQGTPKSMQENPKYADVVEDIKDFFVERVSSLEGCGVSKNKVILDPGLGFGKTTEHNLEILRRLDEFKSMRCPILVGPSRKSFIGNVLGLPADLRLEGTLAVLAVSVMKGAKFLRVHDVGASVRAARMVDAILRQSI